MDKLSIIKDQYLNDIECDERPADDYRTEKEKYEDMGDYLRDRDYDRKMSGDDFNNELDKQLDNANIWLYLIVNKIKNINETLKESQKNES